MKRGVDKILTDRLIDIAGFDGVNESNVVGKIGEVLTANNRTREVGHVQRA